MSLIISCLLIFIAMYLFCALSHKHIDRTRSSKFSYLAQHVKVSRFCAFLLCFIAAICLMRDYGTSIGFVGWWLFATPIVFFIILYINDLKQNHSKKSR